MPLFTDTIVRLGVERLLGSRSSVSTKPQHIAEKPTHVFRIMLQNEAPDGRRKSKTRKINRFTDLHKHSGMKKRAGTTTAVISISCTDGERIFEIVVSRSCRER